MAENWLFWVEQVLNRYQIRDPEQRQALIDASRVKCEASPDPTAYAREAYRLCLLDTIDESPEELADFGARLSPTRNP